MTKSDGRSGFAPVEAKADFPAREEKVLQLWKDVSLLERTQSERLDGADFTFFEGPPTANGPPGIHHVLARAFKDMFPRFRTMQGYRVLRKGGWDTHGLPVEIEVEKTLGLGGKRAIEEYGIAQFNRMCQDSASEYISEWEALTERMAFLVDMKTPYVTYHREYVESLWWVLKQLWDKDLLYQGFKSVPFCPRCSTPLSSHELSLGYRDDTEDPSIYVKFPALDEEGAYFLAWTTTPWTLPGNAALAVGAELDYVAVRDVSGDKIYVAAERAEAALEPGYAVLARCKGADLLARRYRPLYAYLPVAEPYARILPADFVTTADGTGIVHIAPAFGADDLDLGRQHGLPVIQTVLPDGTFREEVTDWRGQFVKDADPGIIAELQGRNLLYRAGTYKHTYPFCWRCDAPLLYYAKETWYIRTSQRKEQLVALNQQINWYPDHIKNGRFGQWLANNVDWALGRDRFWGTPLPIWRSDAPGSEYAVCVGSVAELEALTGRDLSALDLHRPAVDDVTWTAPDGGVMRRVPEVADCWFDSGAMPIAQWHYPFGDVENWERHQQADFICEAIDQTRGWFYTLHAVSTLLFERPAFKNVVCLGHILAADGSKMSKSRGNVVNPWEAMQKFGADATRWTMYAAAPPGNSRRFHFHLLEEVVRKFFNTLWSTYSFHVTYANLARWTPQRAAAPVTQELDRWVLSELQALVQGVTRAYENYDALGCTRPIARFVERLSNWYVRLNRRRFWNGDPAALQTLHEVLVTLSQIMAPAAPFLTEAMYQNLVAGQDPEAPDTVHLSRWPAVKEDCLDVDLNRQMALVQRVARLGHAARQAAQLKVRQPLQEVVVQASGAQEGDVLTQYRDMICHELNVKRLTLDAADDLVEIEVFPLPKQLGQKYGAGYPKIRAALARMDPVQAAAAVTQDAGLTLTLDGESFAVTAEDVEIRKKPRAGYSVAESQGTTVAIATTLTPALEQEGLVRELVRRVQQARKDTGLDIADRITLRLQSSAPALADALEAFGAYLREETLAREVSLAAPDETLSGPLAVDFAVNGEPFRVRIEKIETE